MIYIGTLGIDQVTADEDIDPDVEIAERERVKEVPGKSARHKIEDMMELKRLEEE